MTTTHYSQSAGGRWVEGRWLEGPELQRALAARALHKRDRVEKKSTDVEGPLSRRWELTIFATIFAIALAMRLWDLGTRAVHHDESLHGYFSYIFYTGGGFTHNPLMHGPFLFHMIAGSFWAFGDNEFTMRLPMALFGSALIWLPFFFRNRIGQVGALAAAGLLAFSPALLYYSRFARNDIFMAVFTLGLVISMWRYLDEGRNRWLYLGAAFLALGFATKETQFIVTAILAAFLLFMAAPDVWNWLMGRQSLKEFGRAGGFLVMMGISLPMFAAGIAVIQSSLGITLAAPDGTPGVPIGAPNGPWAYPIAYVFSILFLLIGAAVGLLWKPRVWLTCWVIFAAIFAIFFTSVFTHYGGIGSGVWQSLGYWIAQHDVRRGDQPWYYYFIVTSVYEFLPWLFALGASVFYAIRGNLFTRFLVFWSLATFVAYVIAGEKMPWLLVNITLPMIILTAKAINDIVVSVNWRLFVRNWGLLVIPGAPLFILLIWRLIYFTSNDVWWRDLLLIWGILTVMGFLLLGLYQLASRIKWKPVLGTVALALTVTLLAPMTIRAGWIASYQNGDIPREILVYTQTSPELHRVAKQIDALAKLTPEKEELTMVVDSSDGYSWPWQWYLRRYTRDFYPDYGGQDPRVDLNLGASIYVINARNNSKVESQFPTSIGDGRRIEHRWWFPERYRNGSGEHNQMVPSDFFGTIVDRSRWRGAIDYFLYRKLSEPLGSVDSYVYYSTSLPLDALP